MRPYPTRERLWLVMMARVEPTSMRMSGRFAHPVVPTNLFHLASEWREQSEIRIGSEWSGPGSVLCLLMTGVEKDCRTKSTRVEPTQNESIECFID
jgi:hypothetical protein